MITASIRYGRGEEAVATARNIESAVAAAMRIVLDERREGKRLSHGETVVWSISISNGDNK